MCHCEERSDVGISQYPFGSQGNLRRKRNCLHEIATAPFGGLAMTNLWRSPSYRQPALAVSTAPGAACRSPTMAGACIGSGPKFAGCTRCVGTPHPTTRHRYFNNTPQKCSLSFLRLHFLSAESEKMRASGARSFCSGRQGGAGRKAQTPPSGVGMMSYCQTIYGRSAQNLARFLEHFYEIDFVVIQSVDIPVSSGV